MPGPCAVLACPCPGLPLPCPALPCPAVPCRPGLPPTDSPLTVSTSGSDLSLTSKVGVFSSFQGHQQHSLHNNHLFTNLLPAVTLKFNSIKAGPLWTSADSYQQLIRPWTGCMWTTHTKYQHHSVQQLSRPPSPPCCSQAVLFPRLHLCPPRLFHQSRARPPAQVRTGSISQAIRQSDSHFGLCRAARRHEPQHHRTPAPNSKQEQLLSTACAVRREPHSSSSPPNTPANHRPSSLPAAPYSLLQLM